MKDEAQRNVYVLPDWEVGVSLCLFCGMNNTKG